MTFNERMEGDWLVVELVPGFIEADTGRQFGRPTFLDNRVTTEAGARAYQDRDWRSYGLTKEQALVAAAFEAGMEYQRNRKLRKRIDEACSYGWAMYHAKESLRPDDAMQPEAIEEG